MKRKASDLDDKPFTIEAVKNGLENKKVEGVKDKKVPWVPDHLPPLHFLGGMFGVCGSGKTNAAILLLEDYIKHKCINRTYYIGPSYNSNATVQKIQWTRIFSNTDQGSLALEEIVSEIEKANEEYIEEKEYRRAYNAWIKARTRARKLHDPKEIKRLSKDPIENTRFEVLLERRAHEKPDPEKLKWPKPFIFIDDMTHTEMMSNTIKNKLSNLSLHYRHVGATDPHEDGVGCTVLQAFQTFKSGMPRVVRTNINIIFLFPTFNMTEIEDIYKEVANSVTFETFKKLFFEATQDRHDFLLIEKNPKDARKQFGWGFNNKFIIDPVAEKRKLLFGDENESKKHSRNV